MKLILACLFIFCVSLQAFCQSEPADLGIEELRKEILSLKQETKEIQLHLNRSHREFKTGTLFYALGVGLTIAGSYAEANNGSGGNIFLVGTGCLLVGGILHIDSHKHIGRAGISRVQPNRVASPR
jgi:hypothetical protein